MFGNANLKCGCREIVTCRRSEPYQRRGGGGGYGGGGGGGYQNGGGGGGYGGGYGRGGGFGGDGGFGSNSGPDADVDAMIDSADFSDLCVAAVPRTLKSHVSPQMLSHT